MSARRVFLVCADGEEHLAEIVATPLKAAGYQVSHEGTVLVGDSKVGLAKRHLEAGDPLVVCATARTAGSEWTYRLVNAANAAGRTRAFIVRMEANALLEHMTLGEKAADYVQDPVGALEQLVTALQRHYPVDQIAQPSRPTQLTTAARYMDEVISGSEYDPDAVRWFREELRPELRDRYPDTLTDAEFLGRIGVLVAGSLTRTGTLLFGRRPTDGTPSAVVHCVKYQGIDQTATRDLVIVTGTVPQQIIQARDFVAQRVAQGERPIAVRADSVPAYAYPMVAVREIVANAVVHRDYRNHTSNAHIRLFDDRLEISSPGSLLRPQSPVEAGATLDVLGGQSVKRNFRLAHLLTWIRLVEGEGSGVPTAIQDCAQTRSPLPRITEAQAFVTVRLSPRIPVETGLNPKFQFDTFVIGTNNRFAHAAAVAVAEAPVEAYNPLFIYGESGVGKTHLLHAIGHYTQHLFSGSRVRYVSAEEFTNDFIDSIRDNRPDEFRRRYRDIDVLLIDDIQFLENKEQTQEEFFHTFNTLHNANKQIVISSDRPPKQLVTLEDRLRNRFDWGLIVDLQPAELETRIAILRKKAAQERLDAPPEVLEFIAAKISSNIRELEGALNRVTAFASLNRQNVDVALAEIVLKDLIADATSPGITSATIMAQTAAYFGVSIEELCGSSRSRVLVTARTIGMHLCRELTDLSLPKIGQQFGGRDHTTVMHADRKIRAQRAAGGKIDDQVRELITRIEATADYS